MITRLAPDRGGPPLDADGIDAAYEWPGRRWVRANLAASIDGAIEVEGRSGGLGGPDDRAVFACLRAGADAVLVGSGTVRAENYGAVRIEDDGRARRGRRGQAPAVPVVVLTNRADLDPDAKLFRESGRAGHAPALVVTSARAPLPARRALEAVTEVVVCGDEVVDDAAVLDLLVERGLERVLCEGGPVILGRLLRAGLLDELCLTVAPLLAGPGHAGLLGSEGWPASVPMRLTDLLASDDGSLFARYQPGRGQAR